MGFSEMATKSLEGLQTHLFVVSGPSGAGKTTIIRTLLAKPGNRCHLVVSHTTRRKRPGETEGKEYNFVSKEVFKEMVKNNLFLEWEIFVDNYYGTSLEALKQIPERGYGVLDLELKGVLTLKDMKQRGLMKNVFFINITLDNIDTLRERLVKRQEANLEKRLKQYKTELATTANLEYSAVFINNNSEETAEVLGKWIKANLNLS